MDGYHTGKLRRFEARDLDMDITESIIGITSGISFIVKHSIF
jgi:hypothetical protein